MMITRLDFCQDDSELIEKKYVASLDTFWTVVFSKTQDSVRAVCFILIRPNSVHVSLFLKLTFWYGMKLNRCIYFNTFIVIQEMSHQLRLVTNLQYNNKDIKIESTV